ncbi:hypothetical protein IA01_04025 [Flavobacterium psychrophilum]|uniref:Uncharacterized protein n=1 Tax=Flavobacterium psychrophilum (strain ATCC 49511 / DSM 21280 / CIP 103535 / JIP02/86) TaxID=402612 RepID=A6GXY6_FLAPJ|nr:hypothetical protein [Flavobacterium psychrophilum]AIG29687.1 hypothetical protein IA03_04010 [Flavobacterium psychrophilum]AIG31964.1 hypothetical protein IA01_04025 [Flavobacterium psychrophilum]AIG34119.1 hypothetical protein IA02_03425 [Flavobacterium psychrophilum]AIG36482.1 hypothetical protein IA04_03925 [Flavobacterium psychrophilum]AIG38747.1 hypothetical protein IA05_04010 [Flavobacterium psychrophilum]
MDSSIKSNLLNSFLIVYFYKIENELNNTKNGLETIKFQSEEANTDEFFKRYFQDFLSKHNDVKDVKIKQLAVKIDSEESIIDIEKLNSYKITNVLLPEHLTAEQKKEITKAKKSVYTNPDLYLEITDGTNIYFESVELKSTKDNNIPGSSVQQVSPFEWVIFVKRDSEKVLVTTGFYINSITEKLPFPDRSPRPQIGFKTLLDWNKKYRKVENDLLTIESSVEINNDKIKLLTDWQDYLASEWLEIIKSEESRNNEKWFNNAIRKFALKFLEYSEKLTKSEKEKLKNNLTKLIK